MKIDDIIINEEYKFIVPRVTEEDFTKLKESIKDNGQWHPITINSQNVLLDGHHRYYACKDLGFSEIDIVVRDFDNELYEKLFVIDSNLQRRQLAMYLRGRLVLEKKPILEELAKQNSLSNLKQNREEVPTVRYLTVGRTNAELAKQVDMSHDTLHKIEVIGKKADEEIMEKLEKEDMSVSYAYKMVTREEDHKDIPPLPEGEFDIILADPPWAYDINTRGAPDEHYNTMTNTEIQGLPVPSAENAILFLWATNPKLPQAFEVMREWGFKYKTAAVWIKDKIGTGYYFRGQHELLLVGEKGEMPVPEEKNRPSSVIKSPRQEHSKKPDIYNIIESMYPNRTYLELFARNTKEGWVSWGNELN